MVRIAFLLLQISTALGSLILLGTLHGLVEIHEMAVKLRSVNTGKFHLAADHQTTAPHMPVPSTMIGFIETTVLMPYFFVVRAQNFIMIIGPIATQTS